MFFPRSNSAYAYNSLADFYTDANDYLANPNRTTSPVTLRRFQVQYMNLPGLDKPLQPLEAWYVGGYVQDQWHVQSNVTVTAGLRVDTPIFKNTAYDNPNVDALTFRDENGNASRTTAASCLIATPLWSPRVGFNWDVSERSDDADSRRHRHLHRETGLRVDFESDRQHRRADRQHPGRQHHDAAVQPDAAVSTGRRRVDRRPGRELRAGRHRIRISSSRRRGAPTSRVDRMLPWGIVGDR